MTGHLTLPGGATPNRMVICGKWRRSARKDVAGEEGSSELVQRRTESWRVGNATMVSFRRVLLCGFSGCSQVEGKAMDGRWKRERDVAPLSMQNIAQL
ncbi:hypothetical protein HPP92_027588 [Vanilla planifolia]|uniref:Uncharacterized protein n=1 Tax=Vanilla planifolia TaxID=51239 RepID=A0A835U7F9_VANPL|nr:hypothetical protein HPP92_027588 [Vanilla planifolia]